MMTAQSDLEIYHCWLIAFESVWLAGGPQSLKLIASYFEVRLLDLEIRTEQASEQTWEGK